MHLIENACNCWLKHCFRTCWCWFWYSRGRYKVAAYCQYWLAKPLIREYNNHTHTQSNVYVCLSQEAASRAFRTIWTICLSSKLCPMQIAHFEWWTLYANKSNNTCLFLLLFELIHKIHTFIHLICGSLKCDQDFYRKCTQPEKTLWIKYSNKNETNFFLFSILYNKKLKKEIHIDRKRAGQWM